MNIVICEDDIDYRTYLKTVLNNYISQHKSTSKIVLDTGNPDELFDYIEHNSEITVFFLDVKLECNVSGFDIAAAIRQKDHLSHLVFVTSYQEMMPLTYQYKLEALDYIVKYSQADTKICNALEFAEARQNIGYEKCFNIRNKKSNISISLDKICYIESVKSSHKLILYHDYGSLSFYCLLKDAAKQLDDNFLRCHKSIIVNKNKIKSIDKQQHIIHLFPKYSCAYSKKCKEVIKQ